MFKDISIHRPIWMGFDDLKHFYDIEKDEVKRKDREGREARQQTAKVTKPENVINRIITPLLASTFLRWLDEARTPYPSYAATCIFFLPTARFTKNAANFREHDSAETSD